MKWYSNSGHSEKHVIRTNFKELKAKCPVEIFEKIRLAEQAKLAKDFDKRVTLLLKKGLTTVAPEIKKGLIQQLNEFEVF